MIAERRKSRRHDLPPARMARRVTVHGTAALVSLLAVTGFGCRNTEPSSVIESCVRGASATGEHSGTQVDCDLGREAWVFAIPKRGFEESQVETLHPPQAAIASLRGQQFQDDSWCVADAAQKDTVPYEIDCAAASVEIARSIVVRGRRVNITVENRAGSARAAVTDLRAVH